MKTSAQTLSPSEAQAIAKELGVKPEEVVEMETRLGGQDVALEPLNDDGEESYAPIAYLADANAEPGRVLEHAQEEQQRSQGLTNALASLDPRSRRIIETRWLKEKDQATLHDLAAEFGVSAERIRQIEGQAMKKMKALIQAPTA
jgi:RNA polymerase sigma-32 factor